jgi:hypothetical protein
MGYLGKPKKKAIQLRRAIDDGAIFVEMLSRQSYIFDRTDFPKESLNKLAPTGPNSP